MTYKKFGFLTAIMALSGFYLYTLYLAAHPNVSLAYKLYYLEGKTRFWEHNSSMTYQPGNELNLTRPSRFLSSAGWLPSQAPRVPNSAARAASISCCPNSKLSLNS